jgi:hypothetical protein
MKEKSIQFFFLAIMILLGNAAFSQSKSVNIPTKQETITLEIAIKNHGFPALINYPNTEAGTAEYQKAKIAWIEKNPDLYNRIIEPGAIIPAPFEKNTPKRESN